MANPAKKLLTSSIFKVNLLIRKGEPVKIQTELLKWLLSSGRFIVVFVELIVIGAFIYRYKLDADLADIQEKIKEQIPYIQSLKDEELLLKKTQFQLATIRQMKNENLVYEKTIIKIAQLTPKNIKLTGLTLDQPGSSLKTSISIMGQTPSNLELSAFIQVLQKDPAFSNITLTNISFEGQTTFTITGTLTEAAGSSSS